VGIVRREDELERALEGIAKLKQRAGKVSVGGNREYNPGWHTALDLNNLLTVSEAIALAAEQRKESRGAHFRDDYPEKDPAYGAFNFVISKGADGAMKIEREPLPPMTEEQKQIIEEMK
jgi:succinate dehydrogenase / fumarate reductase flavoprotein subunit